MLIELHILQNHAPSNLNRDDTGSPKDAFFGGIKRSRISSQCIKRSIRKGVVFTEEMSKHIGDRTRHMPEEIKTRLINQYNIDEKTAHEAGLILTGIATKDGKQNKDGKLITQLVFFDKAELEAMTDKVAELVKSKEISKMDSKKLNDVLKPIIEEVKPQSVDIALFGRMTTGEFLADVEASMQVAHAIGTSKMENEYDFFTAVDDLNVGDTMEEHGSGHMGDVEFTSTTYYKYFSCDYDKLVENLNGNKELAKNTLATFVKAAALSMPTGKQNSFAAHNPPEVIIVNLKDKKVPLSYANAFVKPVSSSRSLSLIEASTKALKEYIEKVNETYPLNTTSLYLTMIDDFNIKGEKASNIDKLVDMLQAKL